MPFKQKLSEFVWVNNEGQVELNPNQAAVIKARGLPIKVAYDLSKLGKLMLEELQTYIEQRFELIKKWGEEVMTEGENPQPTGAWRVKATQEAIDGFNKEHGELLEHEVTFEVGPFKIEQLGEKVEGVTPENLMACHNFIVE